MMAAPTLQRMRSSSRRLLERPPLTLVAAAAVLPLLHLIRLVALHGVDVPFWDQWELVPLLSALDGGTLTFDELWAPHNEHRILIPQLVMLGLASVSQWNTWLERIASLVMASGMVLVIAVHLREPIRRGTRVAWALPIISLMVFSGMQWENWLWGWQLQIVMNVLCVVIMVALLVRADMQVRHFAGAMAMATLATLSFATGLLAWAVGVVGLWLRRDPLRNRQLAIWSCALRVVAALYFVDFAPGSRPSTLSMPPLTADRFYDLSLYLLKYLGAAISGTPTTAAMLGFVAIIGFTALAWQEFRRDGDDNGDPAPLLLGLYTVAAGLMTGLGRVGLGTDQAMSSRYVTISTLLWVALAILLARGWSDTPRGRASVAGVLRFTGLVVLGLAIGRSSYRAEHAFEQWHVRMEEGRAALIAGRGEALGILYPDPVALRSRRLTLEALGLSVFRDDAREASRVEPIAP